MALSGPPDHIFLVPLFLLLLPVSAFSQNTNGNITVGTSLAAAENSSPWLSPSGDFAFGFQQLPNQQDLYLLCIWYAKIPGKTVVWYANNNPPATAPKGSKVNLTSDRGLVLTDPNGGELWTPENIVGDVSKGVMTDQGNFLLQDRSSETLWETFDNPTDTILPLQVIERGGLLSSRQSETNFTMGRFQLRMQQDGNLVLNTINLPTDLANSPYYASGTDDGTDSSTSGRRLVFNESGFVYVMRRNNETVSLGEGDVVSTRDNYVRATLNFDGVFAQYYHPKSGSGDWTYLWSIPDDICKKIFLQSGAGVCGFNSICTLQKDGRPTCECPEGYSLSNPADIYGNCVAEFTQSCTKDELNSTADLFDVAELFNTDWPTSDYDEFRPFTGDLCKQSCLSDCMCAVAIFRDRTCWKKKLPLSNGRVDANLNSRAFIKVPKNYSTSSQSKPAIIRVGSLLLAETSAELLSASGDFAFGFRQLQYRDDLFLLCIWYAKIPDKTIVWYANGDYPAPRGSKLSLTTDRGLVLTSPQGRELWNSKPIHGVIEHGIISDTGNFVLEDSNSAKLWQSFSYPTNTIVPYQILDREGVLFSQQSENNHSKGRFQLRFQQDENLVLNTINLPTTFTNEPYYITNYTTREAYKSSDADAQLVFNVSGSIYVLRERSKRFTLSQGNIVSAGDYYFRATLSFDGTFTEYFHPKNFSGKISWTPMWSIPDNICLSMNVGSGVGVCGYNSICSLAEDKRPRCECLRGYSLLNLNDIYSGCKPNFIQGCKEDELIPEKEQYDILELMNVSWLTSDYIRLAPFSKEMCKESCLKDCHCAVAVHRNESCWKKKLPLSNGRVDDSHQSIAFIKVRKVPPLVKNNRDYLIHVGSGLLGGSFFVNLILIGATLVGFLSIYRRRDKSFPQEVQETNLRCFTYKEIQEATNDFKEELGKGSFGVVYKGVVQQSGCATSVAVKKLCSMVQDGEQEFKAEVKTIGQTHHKNLVSLIGYCNEKQHRLLVYEFLSNGTLASSLFGNVRLSWKQRVEMALGISRGLLYLHEGCGTQIIHCDIKPQNILLDKYNNARISDFGLAKLLMVDQSHTNTTIRGTKGYVAPEWFRSKSVTTKVDVYSFGVVLLEIICCRRSLDMEIGEGKEILTDWAYDCYREGTLDVLVDYESEALNDTRNLETFVRVALWCVQENSSLRPTMWKVVHMLEGVVKVNVPPCPYPNSITK